MYDAIVIGAGINGLAAALHLTARGWKVAVVEKAAVAGGAVKTREVTLPGFRHDLCAMNLSMFAGSPFFASHKNDLIRHGLELVKTDKSFATAFPDRSWFGVEAGVGLTSGGNARISEHDAAAWQALTRRFRAEATYLGGLLNSPMPSLEVARVMWRAWRSLGLTGLLALLRVFVASPRDFLDGYFKDPKIKAMMAVWALHLDFTPDTAGGAVFPYLESMGSSEFGMALGKGGADTIVKAMVSLLREQGGELITDASVTSIQTSDGKANAVLLADGRHLEASRAIIANLHPKLVFGGLLPGSGNAAFDEGVASFRSSPGSFMIHLALHDPLTWNAGSDLGEYAYVHLAPDLAMMASAYAEAAAGLLPVNPILVVGQPTAVDPERAPFGKHVLWIQARSVPADIKGDAAGIIDERDWDAMKEAYADRVIDILESYAHGTKRKIMARTVCSPVDLERENASLIGGDALAGSHRLDQNFIFRPVAGWSRYKTPVRKLYLCGASTWPGGGTGVGSGHMLGRILA